MWIFVGRTVQDEEVKGDSWIEAKGYEDLPGPELYLAAVYFSMTTITTVGYGDISATNVTERIICIFLHIIGVLSYSLAAGSLTSIIENYDTLTNKNMAKKSVLDRLNKEHALPTELYFTLLNCIENHEDESGHNEVKDFLDSLPFRLKLRTTMYVYKPMYTSIRYLRDQSDAFIAWVCPLLQSTFIPMDQYIYYESDQIVEIYFLSQGWCGFVLPFKQNMVYVDIQPGDFFGEADFAVSAMQSEIEISDMIDQINSRDFNLTRHFTVQAIHNSQFLTLNIKNLQRMHM